MNTKILLLCGIACVFSACENDQDTGSLNGTWKLTNTTVSDGVSLRYDVGEVIWTFNDKTHSLNILNKLPDNSPESDYSGMPTGNYTYGIQKSKGISKLYINGTEQGAVARTNDNLVISTGVEEPDGMTKVFRR